MKKQGSRTINLCAAWFLAGTLGLVLTGCGDKEAPKTDTAPKATTGIPKATSVVSESEHEKFEKIYAEQCIKARQTESSNDQELGKLCDCMAKAISKRISKADAVHYLNKKEFPFDLVMMTNAAENNCLSTKK
jgi:hypothetical protein